MSENVHAIPAAEVERTLGAAQKLSVQLGENRLDDGSVIAIKEIDKGRRTATVDLGASNFVSGTAVTALTRFQDGFSAYQLPELKRMSLEEAMVDFGRGDRVVVRFSKEDKPVLLELV